MLTFTAHPVTGLPDEDWHAVIEHEPGQDDVEICICQREADAGRIADALNQCERVNRVPRHLADTAALIERKPGNTWLAGGYRDAASMLQRFISGEQGNRE